MERSPLKSRWAEFFFKIHDGLLFRRLILRDLYDHRLEFTVLADMIKLYCCCFVTSFMGLYILRKEAFYVRFLSTAGPFSVSLIYLQLFYEENLYYFKGLVNNQAGSIISLGLLNTLKLKRKSFNSFLISIIIEKNPWKSFVI